MNYRLPFILAALQYCSILAIAQVEVPIDNYSVNAIQVQLSEAEDDNTTCYMPSNPTFEWAVSMTMGVNGTMVISEPTGAYGGELHYYGARYQ